MRDVTVHKSCSLIIFAVVVLLGCQISMELSHHLSSILETGTFGTQVLSRKTHHCRVTKNCLSVNHFLLVGFSSYVNGRFNGSGSGSLLDPKLSWKTGQFRALFGCPNRANCSIVKEVIVDMHPGPNRRFRTEKDPLSLQPIKFAKTNFWSEWRSLLFSDLLYFLVLKLRQTLWNLLYF